MGQNENTRNIVILGGSIGAIGSAHYLLKHVTKHLPDHKLIIVSPNAQFLWRPACPRAAVNEQFANDTRLFADISEILRQYPEDKYCWLQGTATSVDSAAQTVYIQTAQGDNSTLDFDALIIATGASTASPLLGLTGDETKLKDAWHAFQQALPNAKSIVVAGGGPAGIEIAGELGSLLNRPKGWFQPAEFNVHIQVLTAGSQILPHLRPSIAKTAESYLSDLGVTVRKNTRVKIVASSNGDRNASLTDGVTIQLNDGSTIEADLYIPATGIIPNTSFMDPSYLASDGRIKVDSATLKIQNVGAPIYAVGDASTYARPTVHSMFDAIPVMCSYLQHDLHIAAGQADGGRRVDRKFTEDTTETQFVPIGTNRGVGAFAGYRLPSWVVSMAKGRDYLLWASSAIKTGSQWAKE